VIEIAEGVNLDTTSEDKIVGIEILNASKKIDLKTALPGLEWLPPTCCGRVISDFLHQEDSGNRG